MQNLMANISNFWNMAIRV